jgi:hypothetical protein
MKYKLFLKFVINHWTLILWRQWPVYTSTYGSLRARPTAYSGRISYWPQWAIPALKWAIPDLNALSPPSNEVFLTSNEVFLASKSYSRPLWAIPTLIWAIPALYELLSPSVSYSLASLGKFFNGNFTVWEKFVYLNSDIELCLCEFVNIFKQTLTTHIDQSLRESCMMIKKNGLQSCDRVPLMYGCAHPF